MPDTAKFNIVGCNCLPQVIAIAEGLEHLCTRERQWRDYGVCARFVEKWYGIALTACAQNPMRRGLYAATRPSVQHLAEVDGDRALLWWNVKPSAVAVLGLQAAHAVLREHGEETCVRMGAACHVTAFALVFRPNIFVAHFLERIARSDWIVNEP